MLHPPDVTIAGAASITSLPVELLLAIFKRVFVQTRISNDQSALHICLSGSDDHLDRTCGCEDDPYETQWDIEETKDGFGSCIFPYNISLVCHQWQEVAQLVPSFWTRLIVPIDSNPPPLPRIKFELGLSHSLPLDIIVRRRAAFDEEIDEKTYTREVMTLLAPHIWRCRTISFEVRNSSSLPSILLDFYGKAEFLLKLKLKCDVDDGGGYEERPAVRSLSQDFSCPALDELDIDGRNFAYACSNMASWRDCLVQSPRLSVALSNFIPGPGKDQEFSLNDLFVFLHQFQQLAQLSISNVQYPFDHTPFHTIHLPTNSIVLRDLDRGFIGSFTNLGTFDVESFSISNCPLDSIADVPQAYYTHVERIDPAENMVEFMTFWSGAHLSVVECPSFNDEAILQLCNDDGPELQELFIENCPNVSPTALRRLVRKLRRGVENDGAEPFVGLWVAGGAPIMEEERVWFKGHVTNFTWEVQGSQ